MNLSTLVRSRYACKAFTPDKPLTAEQLEQLCDALRFAPSSTNLQPWHFFVATTAEGKERIARAAHGMYASNASKINNASACFIFCAKTHLDDSYIAQILTQEEQDGRFVPNPDFKTTVNAGRQFYADLHRSKLNDVSHWMEKQLYLNLGHFLLGTAAMGLDCVPIEGIDTDMINIEFNLSQRQLTAVVLVAVGFRAENDFNAALPKSRLPAEQIISFI